MHFTYAKLSHVSIFTGAAAEDMRKVKYINAILDKTKDHQTGTKDPTPIIDTYMYMHVNNPVIEIINGLLLILRDAFVVKS